MNFTQISTFRAVMTSQSVSDAAAKLGRTQPAVSAAIKALEEQLGMALFERRGRKLIPVPEAQYLLTEADEILSKMTRVRNTMRSLSSGRTGTLNVAAMPGPVSQLFPRFIASRIDKSDGVSVSLQARTSNQIAELARAQAVDFAFADVPQGMAAETLFSVDIISADCLIALPQAHPLAAKQRVSIADLDGEPMGNLHVQHAHAQAVEHAFTAEGAQFNKTVDSQTFLPLLHFVAAGQCAAIMDPLSVFMVTGVAPLVSGVVIRPMAQPIRYEYALYAPRYRPISILARKLREDWRAEVMRLLSELEAHPEAGPDQGRGE